MAEFRYNSEISLVTLRLPFKAPFKQRGGPNDFIYFLLPQPRPALPQPLPPVSPGLCHRLPVPSSDPVSSAVPTVVSALVHLGQLSPAPVSFSDYSHGPHSRWVPPQASGQVQHSRAGGAGPSSSSSPRASPRGSP